MKQLKNALGIVLVLAGLVSPIAWIFGWFIAYATIGECWYRTPTLVVLGLLWFPLAWLSCVLFAAIVGGIALSLRRR